MSIRDGTQFNGPMIKLGQAAVHLKTLDAYASKVLGSRDNEISSYLDPNDGSYVFVIDWNPIPDYELSLLIGDAAHNMRSALDHLAYLFFPSDGTEFPIYSDPLNPALRRKLDWFPDNGARAYVESLQPHHRTYEGLKLGLLHDIDRFDKHRFLIMAPSNFTIPTSGPHCLRVLDKGCMELRILSPTEDDIEYYDGLKPKFRLMLSLAPVPPGDVFPISHLREIYNLLCYDVIPRLSCFLP